MQLAQVANRIVRRAFHRAQWSPAQWRFAEDFRKATVYAGPTAKASRFRRTYNGTVDIILGMEAGDVVRLSEIESTPPLQGHGGRAMDFLCDLADRHGQSMILMVCPLGTDKTMPLHDEDKLAAFYARRGFAFRGIGRFMYRHPL